MKIHEYQAKEILRKYNVPVPKGFPVFTPEEAVKVAKEELGGSVWVVKAQIHAGGRGKGGGVKVAKSLHEVYEYSKAILGMTLVTHQTGPEGQVVKRLLVEQGINIEKELYIGITLDRAISKNVLMASTEGGMEIEKVAEESPEKIIKETIEPSLGLRPHQARKIAFALGLSGVQHKNAVNFLLAFYKAYDATDASLAEINPLVVTKEGDVMALDAKMNFDYNLNYIKLDGNVGCMVNGAGLAMGTMDIIKLAGGEPANFLDVGGGANKETVANGFKIILSDPNVKAILINIFGGIVRCDRVAEGVINAAKEIDINLPIVVRLEGTNAKEAREMLAKSGLSLIPASTLADAAEKITRVLAANN